MSSRKARKSAKRKNEDVESDNNDDNDNNHQDKEFNNKKLLTSLGLELSRNGKYVMVNDQLFELLNQVDAENLNAISINPFQDYPDFKALLENGTPVTFDSLKKWSIDMKGNPLSTKMADMLGNLPVDWLSLKRSEMKEDNWDYSVKFPFNPKVTDQGHSGRCWMYAALGTLRYGLIKKYNLEHKFEFSESYLFFYDKIERSNMFLEYMWSLRNQDISSRDVRLFTDPSSHFLSDGGTFIYFLNLVTKYGLLPKNVYSEGLNSRNSEHLNETLVKVLNQMALEIFRGQWKNRKLFEKHKESYMSTIYDLVTRFLGEPPKPSDKFNWTYKDEHDETHTLPHLTAESFYKIIVPHNHDTTVVIINDPRHPETYYMQSWTPYSINVEKGMPSVMINLPMDEFKKILYKSLKNEDPVWFAADVSRYFDCEANTFDSKRFDYESVLGVSVDTGKSDMLHMLTSVPNHAMLFNGVDALEDSEGNVIEYNKWRVENSWGMQSIEENDPDHGYFRMTDAFLDKCVYEAAVDIKYFEPDVLEKISYNTKNGNSFTYDPYDAFGTVALWSKCPHC